MTVAGTLTNNPAVVANGHKRVDWYSNRTRDAAKSKRRSQGIYYILLHIPLPDAAVMHGGRYAAPDCQ